MTKIVYVMKGMKRTHIVTLMLLLLSLTFTINIAGAEVWYIADLWAGQNTHVGWVIVEVDGANVVVTYEIDGEGWFMAQTHLYVALDPPSKSAPGKFPYKNDPWDVFDQYVIPLLDIGAASGDTVYIAAHATVMRLVGWELGDPGDPCTPIYEDETAWGWCGEGIPFGNDWARYFIVTVP